MKKLFVFILIISIFVGCGRKSSPVDQSLAQIEKALEKVEKNKGKMTEADWQTLEEDMQEPLQNLEKALESGKVGMMDKLKIVTLTTKWATVLMEAGFNEMRNQIDFNSEDLEKELEDALKKLEEALPDSTQ